MTLCLRHQVTGPVARFCRQICSQGYVCVAPSSYHEFTGPDALEYNAADTDRGNEWKKAKVCSCLRASCLKLA